MRILYLPGSGGMFVKTHKAAHSPSHLSKTDWGEESSLNFVTEVYMK